MNTTHTTRNRWAAIALIGLIAASAGSCSNRDESRAATTGSTPETLPTTTVPVHTSSTAAPTAAPPATVGAACQTDQSAVAAANAPTAVLPTGLWRVIPQSATCLDQSGAIDSVLLEQRDLVTGETLAARSVTIAEIHEADGGTGVPRLTMYPSRSFDGLGLAGIAGRQVVLESTTARVGHDQTTTALVGIDIDTGAITAVPLDDPDRVVGVVGSTILAVNADSIDRADLQTGTLETLTTPGIDIPDATASADGMWFCSTDPSRIVRVDADGQVNQLDQFVGTATMCYLKPVPGSLWAVVTPVGVANRQPGRLQRLDPIDGHVIATAEQRDVPPGGFIAFADTDGYLALLGDWVPGYDAYTSQVIANWWWIDNDGRITELTPPAGVTVLGMAGGRIVGYGPDYQITSHAVADLTP